MRRSPVLALTLACSLALLRSRAHGLIQRSLCLALLAAALFTAQPGCGDDGAARRPEPSRFVTDDEGGALILRGLNVSGNAKYTPDRMPWVTREDVLRISRDWGFNFVRFLIFWDAIEPEPGLYDETYLDLVEERLDWHHEAGLHVVLDMHQDLYAQSLCPPGDGAPPWAVITDGHPPPGTYSQWELYHAAPAVQAAFQNFFDYEGDHPELQDHYLAMWVHVVTRFKDHPAVLGYEIMNEPYSIHALADPEAFDTDWLAPFYRRFIAAVRAVDPEGWIFFEPQAFMVSDGAAQDLPPLEDPRPGPPRLVYFPHLYLLAATSQKDDHDLLSRGLAGYEAVRRAEADAYGTPLAIGEFHVEGGEDQPDFFPWYLHAQLATFDRLLAGWAYWDHAPTWNLLDENGDEKPLAHHLARPYPRRVAGEPTALSFDPDTRVFELRFRDRRGALGRTEIYVPAARHYPDGWTLTVSDPEGTWSEEWDGEREILSLTTGPVAGEHVVIVAPE